MVYHPGWDTSESGRGAIHNAAWTFSRHTGSTVRRSNFWSNSLLIRYLLNQCLLPSRNTRVWKACSVALRFPGSPYLEILSPVSFLKDFLCASTVTPQSEASVALSLSETLETQHSLGCTQAVRDRASLRTPAVGSCTRLSCSCASLRGFISSTGLCAFRVTSRCPFQMLMWWVCLSSLQEPLEHGFSYGAATSHVGAQALTC